MHGPALPPGPSPEPCLHGTLRHSLSVPDPPPRRARHRRLVELAAWGPRALSPPRHDDLARHRAQPGAHAAHARRRRLAARRGRSGLRRHVRRRHRRPRRRASAADLVVEAGRPGSREQGHRLLLGRVRAAPVAAHLRRRPRRAGRRPLQGGQRPRHPAGRHRLHVSAGLLPPAHLERRLAAGTLRTHQLGRRADRNRDHARRQAVHHRGAARRPHGAGGGVARARRQRAALPARHRPRGKRAVGSRALGAPVRRRPRDAHPAGSDPRHRRRARAAGDGHRARRVAPQ